MSLDDTWAPGNHNGLIKQPDSLWLPFRHIPCIVNRVPVTEQEVNMGMLSLLADHHDSPALTYSTCTSKECPMFCTASLAVSAVNRCHMQIHDVAHWYMCHPPLFPPVILRLLFWLHGWTDSLRCCRRLRLGSIWAVSMLESEECLAFWTTTLLLRTCKRTCTLAPGVPKRGTRSNHSCNCDRRQTIKRHCQFHLPARLTTRRTPLHK